MRKIRLINANSIKFEPYYDEYVDYDGYINDLKTWQLDDILSDRVDNAPTVEAIPVKWIEKFRNQFDEADDFYDLLDTMLTIWKRCKEENEI